ncbi:MAG: PD-(D/E)XK nuclease family protein [Gemmatimonadota bacterium]
MSLRIVCSRRNAVLWSACASRFLDELTHRTGPRGYPSYLWIAHRNQRDSLLELAANRRLSGWLAPPFSFFSELRELFRIEARPVGILTGRLLVARLAARLARQLGMGTATREGGPARAHMLDGVFSELLPEGVTPEELRRVLDRLEGDDFARKRNAWVADAYAAFLTELRARDLYDPRSIHAMVAARIEEGFLAEAIGGAGRLHVYGITSLRGRRRLFRALAEQTEVKVSVYLPAEEEPSEWEELATEGVEEIEAPETGGDIKVQPTPDAVREATWVARQVKRLLAKGKAEPHEIGVVARSGRQDTRKMHMALRAAGVPSTARIRTVLAEIPSLKALLELLRGEAEVWSYRVLRQVLASPYFGAGIDLRAIDRIAGMRRVEGLEAWAKALLDAGAQVEARGREKKRHGPDGVSADRLEEDIPRFEAFRERVAVLGGERAERAWIDLTLEVLGGKRFGFRRRLCRPVAERWDIVRLDQRGVLVVEALLREWRDLVDSEEAFGAEEWHNRLRRLLEANELALSTPLQEGVQVLEAHEAALTPFRHVFLVHANDGVFPRMAAGTGVFSDAERGRLRELGLPLANRDEAIRRERTLWRAVTNGERVTITYRTTDANGIPRLPSLMVPSHEPETELPRTLDIATLERVRDDLEPVSPAEQRRRDVQRLAKLRRGGETSVFLTPDPASLRHAVLGAFAEELRAGGLDEHVSSERELIVNGAGKGGRVAADPASLFALDRPLSERPTAWNGKLRDPVVLSELRRRFGEEHVWSASRLEMYGRRPFDFLLEHVLQLGETEEAEEETTPLTFGSAAHALLERFYRTVQGELPQAFDERARALYQRVAEEVFAEFEADCERWLGLPPLWAVTREEVREKVAEYLAWELEHLAKEDARPLLVEYEFGGEGGPVELEGLDARGCPSRLRLRGRMDRVDRYGEGTRAWLRVIDYKSSRIPSAGSYEDGALLQTALYMKTLHTAGHEAVRSGVYRRIKNPQKRGIGAELRGAAVDNVLKYALSIPCRVREGLFEAVQARSTKIEDWQPGREVTRNEARITTGTRFDAVRE